MDAKEKFPDTERNSVELKKIWNSKEHVYGRITQRNLEWLKKVGNGRESSKKDRVLRHAKCHKEFREDKETSSLDSEIKCLLVNLMRMAL